MTDRCTAQSCEAFLDQYPQKVIYALAFFSTTHPGGLCHHRLNCNNASHCSNLADQAREACVAISTWWLN
jgi:hypothetical protein